ncbi:MAG: hypothetical protein WBB98_17395 [Xanthobacteraceae bacterium]
MNDSSLRTTTIIDPSTPFCARTYFERLRAIGAKPHAARNADGTLLIANKLSGVREYDDLCEWAMRGDSNFAARGEYGRAAWANRHPGTELIYL